jgi:hypothetical protein
MDRERSGRSVRIALISVVLVACSSSAPQGLGVRRASGAARALFATADGAWLAFLDGCVEARAQSLPAGTANCDLRVVPAAGGEAALVAHAVTTLPGAVAVSPAGAELAALSGYDYATASGTLVRWRAGAGPRELAGGVTFHGYGPGGTLGYIAGGAFFLAPAGGDPSAVSGITAAASFELAAGERAIVALVRRKAGAGGELLSLGRGRDGKGVEVLGPVARPVGDYAFGRATYAFTRLAQDGAELEVVATDAPRGQPAQVGRSVRAFAFEPDGDAIAFLADAAPGKQGNLRVRAGSVDLVLGKEVGEFRWAARSPRLAWIEDYDARIRSGALGVGGLSLPRRTLGKNVSDMELSSDGKWVAFLQHTTRGGYSVDLLLAAVDAPEGTAPIRITQGSYGFAFSPDCRWLYYRTRCTRSGEACDLERVPVGPAHGTPEKIAEGIKSFEFDPRDPGRLLVTWKRLDREALDVAVWEGGRLRTVDTYVLPGSARFLATGSPRVAYVVMHEKRAGVYLADLSAAPPAR